MSDKYEKKPIMAESLGNAGEIHQINSNEQQKLTTNHGLPISDNQNSLRMGERGPEYQCLPVSQLLRVVKDLKIHRVMCEVLL